MLETRIDLCISSDGLEKPASNGGLEKPAPKTCLVLSRPSEVLLEWADIGRHRRILLDEDQAFQEDVAQLAVLDDYDAGRALYVACMGCSSINLDVAGKISDALRLSRVLADAARDYGGKFPYAKLQKSAIESLGVFCDSHAYIEMIINEIGILQPNDNNRTRPPKAQDSSQ